MKNVPHIETLMTDHDSRNFGAFHTFTHEETEFTPHTEFAMK